MFRNIGLSAVSAVNGTEVVVTIVKIVESVEFGTRTHVPLVRDPKSMKSKSGARPEFQAFRTRTHVPLVPGVQVVVVVVGSR